MRSILSEKGGGVICVSFRLPPQWSEEDVKQLEERVREDVGVYANALFPERMIRVGVEGCREKAYVIVSFPLEGLSTEDQREVYAYIHTLSQYIAGAYVKE